MALPHRLVVGGLAIFLSLLVALLAAAAFSVSWATTIRSGWTSWKLWWRQHAAESHIHVQPQTAAKPRVTTAHAHKNTSPLLPWKGAIRRAIIIPGPTVVSYYIYTHPPSRHKRHVHQIALVKSAHSLKHLQSQRAGIQDFMRLADAQMLPLMVALPAKAQWQPAGSPHFAKLTAVRAAWAIGYSWALLTDLDVRVPAPAMTSSNALHDLVSSFPKTADLVLQDEPSLCSCVLFLRRSPWSESLLTRWWATAVQTQCCAKHTQLALWGVLANEAANPAQARRDSYMKRIRTSPPAQLHLSSQPLHHALACPESAHVGAHALFHHAAHWNATGAATCEPLRAAVPQRGRRRRGRNLKMAGSGLYKRAPELADHSHI